MTILEAAGDLLQAQMPAFTLGTNLHLGKMIDTPDVHLAVYEYQGPGPVETFGPAYAAILQPNLQVVSRAAREDYVTARDNALAARAILAAVVNTNLGGLDVLRIKSSGDPMPQGVDEKNRPRFSVNFTVQVLA